MHIIAHRGEWTNQITPYEGNSIKAFKLALSNRYGIEVDIRDLDGKLVVSHNPATSACFKLTELLSYYQQNHYESYLAFNIKADGLQSLLTTLLKQFDIENYFTFDMSIPNTIIDSSKNMKYFLRQSEYELYPETLGQLYIKSSGIWVDQFEWEQKIFVHNLKSVKKHLENGKKVCWVSPELHPWGRENNFYISLRNEFKNYVHKDMLSSKRLLICTDYPHLAQEVFNNEY